MTAKPLELTLDPLPATRAPPARGRFEYGVNLRLAGGPVVLADDPLLGTYGAAVRSLHCAGDTEAMDRELFDPGQSVALEIEFDADGDSIVGVWDLEGVSRAGAMGYVGDCPIVAALDHGLPLQGVVVREHVDATTHSRVLIDVLIYAPGFVLVDVPSDLVIQRPERVRPRRVVMLANREGELFFWDPAGMTGPAGPDDLPLSPALSRELARLRARYAELSAEGEPDGGFDELEHGWIRENLEQRTTILWRRARTELGRRFAVGFQGPEMSEPIWSPSELSGDACDDDPLEFLG